MIDYTAAGFTLLQGAHLYAPEDRGVCDVLVANGKIIAVASNIPSDIVPDCTVVAQKNMKVLIVDADPQSDVSAGFGYRDCDDSNETLLEDESNIFPNREQDRNSYYRNR